MPCNDGRDYDRIREVYVEKGTQTSRLCAVFTVLEKRGLLNDVLANCDWKESGVSQKSTLDWWERHKREDVERRQREARQREQDRKRKQLLSKLTIEEKRILNIRD